MFMKGDFINSKLRESYINQDVIKPESGKRNDAVYMGHLGLGGRLNRPVDNPTSSSVLPAKAGQVMI
jgi:hypothetical protein